MLRGMLGKTESLTNSRQTRALTLVKINGLSTVRVGRTDEAARSMQASIMATPPSGIIQSLHIRPMRHHSYITQMQPKCQQPFSICSCCSYGPLTTHTISYTQSLLISSTHPTSIASLVSIFLLSGRQLLKHQSEHTPQHNSDSPTHQFPYSSALHYSA